MKVSLSIKAASVAAVMLTMNAAQAAVIVNVDITTHQSTYAGIGAIGTGTFWNTGTSGTNLKAEDGTTVTGIGHSLSGTFSPGGVGADISLFSDYFNAGPATLTLTGLDNSKTYTLILYGAQNFLGGRGATFTVGDVSKTTTGDQQSTFAEGVNYVRYDNLSPTGGVLTATVSTGPESVGIFNGFQLQAIPEPSSALLMLGATTAGLLLRRRKLQ